jgi:D-glycero-alpha-D-manno-heptose 1-phosphate guanylyltransferase
LVDIKLVILAGGFGTRLKSVVKDLPKPLAPINGIPFLEYLLVSWRSQGITHFIFSLHYHADLIIEYVESVKNTILNGCKFSFVIEDAPLGTGGAMIKVINDLNLTDFFYLANADTWLENGIEAILNEDNQIMVLVKVSDTSRYGRIAFDNDNLITKIEEKSNINESGFINAGLYKFNVKTFRNMAIKYYSLENDLLPQIIFKKEIFCKVVDTSFIDIGIPDDYERFNKWIGIDKAQSL